MFRARTEAPPVEIFPGVVRHTLSSSERAMLVEVQATRGSGSGLHSHPHDELGYVTSGQMRVQVGGETRDLAPGESYCAPAGETHAIAALDDAVCLIAFAPLRTEYLDR